MGEPRVNSEKPTFLEGLQNQRLAIFENEKTRLKGVHQEVNKKAIDLLNSILPFEGNKGKLGVDHLLGVKKNLDQVKILANNGTLHLPRLVAHMSRIVKSFQFGASRQSSVSGKTSQYADQLFSTITRMKAKIEGQIRSCEGLYGRLAQRYNDQGSPSPLMLILGLNPSETLIQRRNGVDSQPCSAIEEVQTPKKQRHVHFPVGIKSPERGSKEIKGPAGPVGS